MRRHIAISWCRRVTLIMAACVASACAGRTARSPSVPARLTFENASPAVVRVFVLYDDRTVWLGLAQAFETIVFAVNLPPTSNPAPRVRVGVRPLGSRGFIEPGGPAVILSDPYLPDALARHDWRLSEAGLIPVASARRIAHL